MVSKRDILFNRMNENVNRDFLISIFKDLNIEYINRESKKIYEINKKEKVTYNKSISTSNFNIADKKIKNTKVKNIATINYFLSSVEEQGKKIGYQSKNENNSDLNNLNPNVA